MPYSSEMTDLRHKLRHYRYGQKTPENLWRAKRGTYKLWYIYIVAEISEPKCRDQKQSFREEKVYFLVMRRW